MTKEFISYLVHYSPKIFSIKYVKFELDTVWKSIFGKLCHPSSFKLDLQHKLYIITRLISRHHHFHKSIGSLLVRWTRGFFPPGLLPVVNTDSTSFATAKLNLDDTSLYIFLLFLFFSFSPLFFTSFCLNYPFLSQNFNYIDMKYFSTCQMLPFHFINTPLSCKPEILALFSICIDKIETKKIRRRVFIHGRSKEILAITLAHMLQVERKIKQNDSDIIYNWAISNENSPLCIIYKRI